MNEIVNKFLSAGDKFLPEMHLRQPVFTYTVRGTFTKERIQKVKETGNSQYIYQSELDKASFQHDMVYGDFKDFTRRTVSDEILHDKAFNITKIQKYDRYQRGLASMVYNFFDKITSGGAVKKENMSNKELAKELHKPIIRTFKKRKVHSPFIVNIWCADQSDMKSMRKFNKQIRFLLCAIDIFSKHAWIISLIDKRGIIITKAFYCKPNKI